MPCQKIYASEWRLKNKELLKIKKREYRENNPDKWRNRNLIKNYNITLNQYNQILIKQNYTCYICKKPESSKRNTKLCVDHCHTTNKIRSLLCNNCNRALGLLKEDFNSLLNLAKYVQEHNSLIQPAPNGANQVQG